MNLSRIEALELTFQFEAIFEAFPDILFKISVDGEILSYKAGKHLNHQLNPAKYIGKNISDLFTSRSVHRFYRAMKKLRDVGDVASFEFPYEHEGRDYWFEVRLVPFYKSQVLAIVRDITEKKELALQLLEASDIRSDMPLNGDGSMVVKNGKEADSTQSALEQKIAEYNQLNERLNHEINLRRGIESTLKLYVEDLRKHNKELEHFRYLATNDFQEPLRAISSFAQMLAMKFHDQTDKESREMFSYMIEGAENMQRILFKLSDYTSLIEAESGNERVDITSVVESNEFKFKDQLNELDGSVIIETKLPVVYGKRNQLNMLFEHLFDNAIKYARENVPLEIKIGASENEDYWKFYIKDNGQGFNPEMHDKIFMLFQRLQPRNHRDGAGIGLSFCKRIVENHGGEIWAESKPNEGSAFYFTLMK